MTYVPKAETASWEPIPGVEWRDYADAEFDALCAEYDKGFPDQPRSLERWFDHVADSAGKAKNAKAAAPAPAAGGDA